MAGVEAEKMLKELFKGKEEWKGAELELREYLAESFGNNTRYNSIHFPESTTELATN